MSIQHLLLLLLRFINPYEPAEPLDIPEPEMVMEAPEIESPAYIQMETGETVYLEDGQDGTDVFMADLF